MKAHFFNEKKKRKELQNKSFMFMKTDEMENCSIFERLQGSKIKELKQIHYERSATQGSQHDLRAYSKNEKSTGNLHKFDHRSIS